MSLEINTLASVTERDIDLLVLEELSVNAEFREWLSTRVYGTSIYQAEVGAWHSVTDSMLGETDIAFVFYAETGDRLAVLIENKISAPPQPQQAERYKQRGEKGIKEGLWKDFRTCSIAPDRYLVSTGHSQKYDTEIGYEEILAFFCSRKLRDTRFSYKATLVQEAIEQNRRGYQPQEDATVTAFWQDYWLRSRKHVPELGMKEPGPKPSTSNFIQFNPRDFPRGLYLMHKITSGYIDLQFGGAASRLNQFQNCVGPLLTNGMEVAQTGKSASVRIRVPTLNMSAEAAAQSSEILSGFQAAELLVKWFRSNKEAVAMYIADAQGAASDRYSAGAP